jgi:Surface-adhesin protein E
MKRLLSVALMILVSLVAMVGFSQAGNESTLQASAKATNEEWGADWTVNFATEYFTYLYDKENIEEVSSGILRILQKWVPSPQKVEEMVQKEGLRYANWNHSLLSTELKCGEGQQRLLEILEFDTSGNVTYTEDYPNSYWVPIISGSVGEALFKAICPKGRGR